MLSLVKQHFTVKSIIMNRIFIIRDRYLEWMNWSYTARGGKEGSAVTPLKWWREGIYI